MIDTSYGPCGDVVVWLPSTNVLAMSALMTNGSYPVIDESSCGPLHGMIQAIERLLPIINAEHVSEGGGARNVSEPVASN